MNTNNKTAGAPSKDIEVKKDAQNQGLPSWVVLTVENPKTAAQFYDPLLGWDEAGETGHESIHDVRHLGGIPVVGITQNDGTLQSKWRIHIQVANLDETTNAVLAAGGNIIREPEGLKNAERFSVVADPSGAEFAVQQNNEHNDVGLLNGPGTFAWSELITDDVQASYAFYNTLFGWALSEPLTGDLLGRREWLGNGRPIAGLLPRPSAMPKEIPPYWDVFFAVTDPAATVEKAVSLGGKNLMPPIDIPHGRIAVFVDPSGIVFSIIKPKINTGK